MASIQEILALLGQQVADTKPADEEKPNDSLVIVKKPVQSLADIMADPLTKPFGWQTEAPEDLFTRGEPIGPSLDLDRILKLKRRTPFDDLAPETKEAIVELEMQKYAKHNDNCRCKEINTKKPCLKTLLPIQAFVLREIAQAQGIIGQIPPGSGKTMLNVLAPLALTNVRSVLLLIPASLRKQLQKDYMMIAQHFVVPNIVLHIGSEKPVIPIPERDPTKPTLHVLPYSRLSMESESNFLVNLQPDAIIADESDAVRSMISSRGMRLAKWFSGGETPEERQKRMSTKFCGWTGSLIDHSITELNWPSLFALKNTSPLPLDPRTVEDWARCLDPNGCPAPPGALLDFCTEGESVHSGYGRRLAETPGFVITSDNEIKIVGTDIVVEQDIRERESPELPAIVNTALESVRQGIRPDYMIPGADPDAIEELEDALAIAKAAQQVSNGVLYYWQYPRGEPVQLIKEWLLRRRDYNKEVREQALLGETFLDSEKLCRDAARRFYGEIDKRHDRPDWQCHSWPAWRDIMNKVEPLPSSWVMHDFLVDDIQEWLADNTGIVWYSMSAIARRLREKTGLPIHDGGPGAEDRLMAEDGSRSIICSISSNGRGRDGLQFSFNKQLLVNPPASQTWFEQVLARSHRRGQKAETVFTEFYAHTPEVKKAVTQAFKRSAFVRDLMKQRPRLLTGYRE